jgi:TRAP-type C4-dicarboxylate transport system permease small subunit
VSEPSDGDGSEKPPKASPVEREIDVPSTRKQGAVKLTDVEPDAEAEEPPLRASAFDITAPSTFPEDGPLAAMLRKIDRYIGIGELGVLVGLLVMMVVVAAGNALLDKIAGIQIHIKEELVAGGTYAIALVGAAFATQQMRQLSMDLISRRFSARSRLVLKVVLAAFTIGIVVLFVRAGLHTVAIQKDSEEAVIFTPRRIAWMIPIGGVLIIIHTVLHMIIDVDYLARGKTPSDRMRSGH